MALSGPDCRCAGKWIFTCSATERGRSRSLARCGVRDYNNFDQADAVVRGLPIALLFSNTIERFSPAWRCGCAGCPHRRPCRHPLVGAYGQSLGLALCPAQPRSPRAQGSGGCSCWAKSATSKIARRASERTDGRKITLSQPMSLRLCDDYSRAHDGDDAHLLACEAPVAAGHVLVRLEQLTCRQAGRRARW